MKTYKRCLMLLFVSLTCFFSLESMVIAAESAQDNLSTTQMSIKLSERADLPAPKPNQPVGPQGSPKTIEPKQVASGKTLPQMNDIKGKVQLIIGLMLLLLCLILLLLRQQNQQMQIICAKIK